MRPHNRSCQVAGERYVPRRCLLLSLLITQQRWQQQQVRICTSALAAAAFAACHPTCGKRVRQQRTERTAGGRAAARVGTMRAACACIRGRHAVVHHLFKRMLARMQHARQRRPAVTAVNAAAGAAARRGRQQRRPRSRGCLLRVHTQRGGVQRAARRCSGARDGATWRAWRTCVSLQGQPQRPKRFVAWRHAAAAGGGGSGTMTIFVTVIVTVRHAVDVGRARRRGPWRPRHRIALRPRAAAPGLRKCSELVAARRAAAAFERVGCLLQQRRLERLEGLAGRGFRWGRCAVRASTVRARPQRAHSRARRALPAPRVPPATRLNDSHLHARLYRCRDAVDVQPARVQISLAAIKRLHHCTFCERYDGAK